MTNNEKPHKKGSEQEDPNTEKRHGRGTSDDEDETRRGRGTPGKQVQPGREEVQDE